MNDDGDCGVKVMPKSSFLAAMLEKEGRKDSNHDYLAYHRKRFEYTLAACCRLKPDRYTKVLDVGRSFMSWRLASHYDSVTTLGFPIGTHGFGKNETEEYPGSGPVNHIVFNLNDSERDPIPTNKRFDLIIFAEIIEHLVTAPELVLRALASLLEPEGILLVQTPNAAAIQHRLKLAIGINPFMRLRFNPDNPGHIREYTKCEIEECSKLAGLRVVEHHYADYFRPDFEGLKGTLDVALRAMSILIPSFRRGQTVILKRAEPSS